MGADWQEAGERQTLAGKDKWAECALAHAHARFSPTANHTHFSPADPGAGNSPAALGLCLLMYPPLCTLSRRGDTRPPRTSPAIARMALARPHPACSTSRQRYLPSHRAHRPSSPNDYVTDSHDHMSTACFFLRTLVDLTCASNGPTRLFLSTLLGRQMPQNVRYPTSLP